MKIKMIVMDMDGTLLNKNHEISEMTKRALLEAQKNGVKIVLASGRSYRTLIQYAEVLEMAKYDGYFIGVNGAAITQVSNMKHEVLAQLQVEEIHEIFKAVKPFEIEAMAVLDDTIYDYIPVSLRSLKKAFRLENNISDDVPWTAGTFSMIVDQRKGYNYIYDIQSEEEVKCPVNKVCLAHTADHLVKPYEYLMNHLSHKYNFTRTSPQWIECAPKSISKGNALKQIANQFNIRMDEIVVFGDGENDLSMFEVVKYAVAMGNAMECVKEASFEVTDTNNQDGIAKFLKKYEVC